MIKNVVIPMAGKGTRLFPLTKINNKATLPFGNKTIIERIIDSFCFSSITDIYLIISPNDNLIPLLGYEYKKMKIHYIIQKECKGLADAVLNVERKINDDKFLLILCDAIFEKQTINELLEYAKETSDSIILLKKSEDDLKEYGIADVMSNTYVKRIMGVNRQYTSLNNIIVGCYILNKSIFEEIKNVKLDSTGEINYNVALDSLAKKKKLRFLFLKNNYYDVGTIEHYLASLKTYFINENS